MKQLIFSTGNREKFMIAEHTCKKFGIKLVQQVSDIIEIQSEDPEVIARDKAAKVFAVTNKPVVVTDDSWALLGLKGFPGSYMHAVNKWFTPDDFLRLTLPLKDRRVIQTSWLVFDDGRKQKVFHSEIPGTLLKEIRGKSVHPSNTVISLEGDKGLSQAEVFAQTVDQSERQYAKNWHDLCAWLTSNARGEL
jgi:inosine/xanthosine triphosphate pyrophosphatase family protein